MIDTYTVENVLRILIISKPKKVLMNDSDLRFREAKMLLDVLIG